MAEDLAKFLMQLGPEFEGKAQFVAEQLGSGDLDEIIDLVEVREDLKELDQTDMKRLHINKLFKAIVKERERRFGAAPAVEPVKAPAVAAPVPVSSTFQPAERVPAPTPKPTAPAGGAVAAAPFMMPKLEKSMSTVPEDEVKEPKAEVVVRDRSKHSCVREQATLIEEEGPGEEYPALKPAAKPRRVPQAEAFERAQRMAKLAEIAAAEARSAVEAGGGAHEANANIARLLIDKAKAGGAQFLTKDDYDRVVELHWDAEPSMMVAGTPTVVDSPISAMPLEDFKAACLDGLREFCEANSMPDWKWQAAEVEAWISYLPNPEKPRRGRPRPRALVMFRSLEDADGLREIYKKRTEGELSHAPLKIKRQMVHVQRPDPDVVRQAVSSAGSDVASEAPSKAGSDNSHSSMAGQNTKNMTLIFWGIPEDVHNSDTRKPAAKQIIETFVAGVCKGAPIDAGAFVFSASFSVPRRAPAGGCYLTFRYNTAGKRIDPESTKAYSFEAYKALQKDKVPEKKIVKNWGFLKDATAQLERMLGGSGAAPKSIARWFMDVVNDKADPKVLPTMSGKDLRVEWMKRGSY